MTYFSKLISRYGVRSDFLYEVTKGVTTYYRTASKGDVTYNDQVYDGSRAGKLVWHDELRHASIGEKEEFRLKFGFDDPLAQLYLGRQYTYDTSVVVRHVFETGETRVVFQGNLADIDVADRSEIIELVFYDQLSYLDLYPQIEVMSPTCTLDLYGTRCGVLRASFTITAEVTVVDGVSLTIPDASAQVNQYYRHGIVKFGDEERRIRKHVGSAITLDAPIDGLVATDDVELSAGCDRKLSTCNDKFANLPNPFAFPNINVNPTRL